MSLDAFFNVADWYQANVYLLLPLFISIFVLGISLTIFINFGDRYLRLPLLTVIAVVLFVLSFFPGDYTSELYLNLSMMVFLALLAVFIVAFAEQQESWFLPVALASALAIGLQFFTPARNIGSNIPTTLGTTLIGAVIVAYMLRQEWAFSPVKQEKRLSAAMRQARKEQNEKDAQYGDYFMLIAGRDEGTITERIDFLKGHDMKIIRAQDIEYDEYSENYYQLVNVQIETVVKDQESVFLTSSEARVRILAYPDTLKMVYKQMGEVLVGREQKRIEAPDPQMAHIEFKVNVPERLFSAMLEKKVYDLAREWQYGDDEHLQHATEALMNWATAEGLVQA